MDEFELIKKYFVTPSNNKQIILGVGDDCALLEPSINSSMAISTDTLVEGVHFFNDVDSFTLGYKALAVNLSDLAAMGAKPLVFTLALTMPKVDTAFLEDFSKGLLTLAQESNISLVGGDTTRGPLSITITVIGEVVSGKAFRRSNAKVGDYIFVTGPLGGAALGVGLRLGKHNNLTFSKEVFKSLDMPYPRIDMIDILARSKVNCAIDISDGVIADLNHILSLSHVGAVVYLDDIPLNHNLLALDSSDAKKYALAGGEDYELCFTVSAENCEQLRKECKSAGKEIFCIGKIIPEQGLTNPQIAMPYKNFGKIQLVAPNGKDIPSELKGYMHF